MQNQAKSIRRMPIRRKLILWSYLFITPILLIISMFMSYVNYNESYRDMINASFQSMQSLTTGADAVLNRISEFGTYVSVNEDIAAVLVNEYPKAVNLDPQLWYHGAPMEILQDIMAIDGEIKTVAIYPENGVNPFLRCLDDSAYLDDFEAVKNEKPYRRALAAGGRVVWKRSSKTDHDIYVYNRSDKLVMCREIFDMSHQTKLAYLAIGASTEPLDSICRAAVMKQDENVALISEDGMCLSITGTLDIGEINSIVDAARMTPYAPHMFFGSTEDYMIYECISNDGVKAYKITPRTAFSDIVKDVITMPVALMLGFIIALLPILIIISSIITGPLNKLTAAMDKFKAGDFTQKVDVRTHDEMGEVSACFNSMVDDIKELIDRNYVMEIKERDSELATLQAQINPHFLYNSLDSLYWKAIEAGDDEIGEDIYALSQLFRLVLSRGEGRVPVRVEAELVEHYLHLQRMRFGKRLAYEINIEDSIDECYIPKLILQPFVENAVIHGFEKGKTDYSLTVTGRLLDDEMKFVIEDTGVGMSKEKLDNLWNADDKDEGKYQRIGRYAIRNVKERLELSYGDRARLNIESEEGKGTTVTIVIPCDTL